MKCSCVAVCVVLCFGICIGQSPCSTPDNSSGDCRSILECPSLRSIVNKPSLTPDERKFLRRSACGFLGAIPKACCPVSTQEQPSEQKTCFTPEGYAGECRRIFDCDHIVKRLQAPVVSPEDRAYVNSIKCEVPTGFQVCCGPPPPPSGACVPSAAPPDPRSRCCGKDESTANNRLAGVGGNVTFIDQYPWLAIVERRNRENETKLVCGGSLISGRYVMTAAHCVAGAAGTPSSVRLGEYDISHSGSDCTNFFFDGEDCSEEPVVIAIERVITHPGYDPTSSLKRHDIALLRLSKLAPYTDFIRPICLPTSDLTASPPPRLSLVTAGWGANETHAVSSVKLQVFLPYKTIEECQVAYNSPRRRTELWRGQMCAGGEEGKDSCRGDSGGPLMNIEGEGGLYEAVGVVSFGSSPCGRDHVPGVYTKVFEYLPWIRDNMRV